MSAGAAVALHAGNLLGQQWHCTLAICWGSSGMARWQWGYTPEFPFAHMFSPPRMNICWGSSGTLAMGVYTCVSWSRAA